MKERFVTRRLMLVGAGVGLAAIACSDDETTSDGAGGSNAGGNNTGGSNNTGGMNAGGMNAGGANAGGMNTGGDMAACGMALVAQGSNYASDPHDITVPMADIMAGAEKSYTCTPGVGGHTHMVTFTAADFMALQNGETVKKYICPQPGTDHEWVFSCADPNVMPTFEGTIGTPNDCPAA